MTRQRWLRSSFSCELKPSRHLENRIVFCNDCLSNRTLWVSASGTLDCSNCGSQNWMHMAVPLANRPRVVAKSGPAKKVENRLTVDARAVVAAPVKPPEREFGKERHLLTLEQVTDAASHLAGWFDSGGHTAVHLIQQMLGKLRTPLHGALFRIHQALRTRLCCIRNWLAPAKQA
jgi:hypothetical protein